MKATGDTKTHNNGKGQHGDMQHNDGDRRQHGDEPLQNEGDG